MLLTMNEAPIPPAPNECCGNGCEPCVWDIYREELRKWQKTNKTATDQETSNDNKDEQKIER